MVHIIVIKKFMKKYRIITKIRTIGCVVTALMIFFHANAQQLTAPPIIPVGLDAYLMWDQTPVQRIGARAYMRSTYDRRGGNETADGSHFLFMEEEEHNVTLDVIGKGVLYFKRTNHWHGSPWRYSIDGNRYTVRETATADPVDAKKKFDKTFFIPEKPFPEPLIYTWSTTKGSDLMWIPIPFERSFQMAYGRTYYGTGYYIYHHYTNEEYLSRPIKAWTIDQIPDKRVLDLINSAGADIAPKNIKKQTGSIKLDKETVKIAGIQSVSSIRALKFTLPLDKAIDMERIRLRVTWDNRKHPSIDAPLCLFFGAGTLYNREQNEYMVKGLPINIRFDYKSNKVELACYYSMPFFKSARLELYGITPSDTKIDYEIRYEPYQLAPNQSSYFHATYKDFPEPEAGKDLVLLDTKNAEGTVDWSGNFMGTSFIFSHDGILKTVEGDPRFFFDDSQTPQAQGTGTEEWGGGGDSWGGLNMTLPFVGHPCGIPRREDAKNKYDLIHSAYRFLFADLFPFGKRAVIRLEHGGENLSYEHYESVTYWYGLPAPSLILTDEIDIGNEADERLHKYVSLQASDVYTIVSRYEWGIDHFPKNVVKWGGRHMDTTKIIGYRSGKEVFSAHQETGRYTKGNSEFTVKVKPDNHGALIRRTLDYSFPNQKAEIYVAEERSADWRFVGIWYLAGSNTCVHSYPRGELDKRLYNVVTSNRRFRDDEFLIPAKFTQGISSLRIKVKHIADDRDLYPGMPFPKKSAWSEIRYKVYSYVMPDFR